MHSFSSTLSSTLCYDYTPNSTVRIAQMVQLFIEQCSTEIPKGGSCRYFKRGKKSQTVYFLLEKLAGSFSNLSFQLSLLLLSSSAGPLSTPSASSSSSSPSMEGHNCIHNFRTLKTLRHFNFTFFAMVNLCGRSGLQ